MAKSGVSELRNSCTDYHKIWRGRCYGHTMRKQGSCLDSGERDNDNARNNVRCMQARKTTHDLDGQHQYVDRTPRRRVNQNDRDKWRKYVHGVANPLIEDG